MKISGQLLFLSFLLLINALPTPDGLLLEKQDAYNVYSAAESYVNGISTSGLDLRNAIVAPQNGDIWRVGQEVEVRFRHDLPSNETVSIFFYHQTDLLAGGSLEHKEFHFVVPPKALSPPGEYSLLTCVRRIEHYLSSVDTVNITVLPALT